MMGLIGRIGFAWVKWKSRHGLRDNGVSTAQAQKQEALQMGVCGEAYAYGYLRAPRLCFHRAELHALACEGRAGPELPKHWQ
jgi:hypothetical protein